MTSSLRKLVFVALIFLCVIPSPSTSHEPEQVHTVSKSRALVELEPVLRPVLDAEYLAAYVPPPPVPQRRHPVRGPREGTEGTHHRGYASAKECVMWVENGGDYGRSSNPSHFGRYQFSRSTWASFGGDPDTWGSASPAEQDAVFETAWNSPGGPNNWLPYDGCGPL